MLASAIFKRVEVLTLDEDSIRWPLWELALWLNDGLLEIVNQKPSARARTVELLLNEGTLQTLPSEFNSLLRVIRNIRTDKSDRAPRKIVTPVSSAQLDRLNPAWHDASTTPYRAQAMHVIFDEANPRQFYVYPGNDGTGAIEVVVGINPQPLHIDGNADPDDPTTYDVIIDIDDIYFNALLYFVLYRAYAKDSQVAGAINRAQMYYSQFANALNLKLSAEINTSPNAKPGVPSSAAGVTN